MNIYNFFNSPDVAEYCQSIGHTFNAIESAVMISQSDSRTLAEKHAAYRVIIAEYPDMELPVGSNHNHIPSFHKVLSEIITYEEAIIAKFLEVEPGTVYRALIDNHHREIFTTYEKALSDSLDYIKSDEEDDSLFANPTANSHFTIRKKYLDIGSEKEMMATTSRNGELMSINHRGVIEWDKNDDYDVDYILESIYIDVPVPFKKGDLVEVGGIGHLFGRSESPYGGVYVLVDICRNNEEQHKRMLLRNDLMDMTADIYYEEDGSIECEVMHFYPDLRYCKRELTGETRILKYVSFYMQEKICLCSLLKMQKYFMLDEKLNCLKENYNLHYQLDQIDDALLKDNIPPNAEKLWQQGIFPLDAISAGLVTDFMKQGGSSDNV